MGPHSGDLISSLLKGSASHPSGNLALFPLEALGMTLPRHRAEGGRKLLAPASVPQPTLCKLLLVLDQNCLHKEQLILGSWFGKDQFAVAWAEHRGGGVSVWEKCERSFTSAHTGNTKDWKPFRTSRGLLLTDGLPPATCHHLKSPSSPKVELPSKAKHSTQDHKWMFRVQTTANTFSGCRVKRCSSAFGRWIDIRVKIQMAY